MNDPAMISSGYDRLENDAYYTRDIVCMDALMWGLSQTTLVDLDNVVWEPFAGGGHISNYLKNRGMTVYSSDINPQYEGCKKVDYYNRGDIYKSFINKVSDEFSIDVNDMFDSQLVHDVIITNPPFEKKLAEQFVRDMIKKCEKRNSRKTFTACVLLRNEWDSAGSRLDIFDSPYFNRKIVITQRPKWMKVTEESSSPRHNYSWFVFSNIRASNNSQIMHYHPSKDTGNYEKVGRKYKRKYTETGLEYIY